MVHYMCNTTNFISLGFGMALPDMLSRNLVNKHYLITVMNRILLTYDIDIQNSVYFAINKSAKIIY